VTRILVATTNPGKRQEFSRLLAPVRAEVVSLTDIGLEIDVPEPHDTYRENAVAKAVACCAASSLITLADDSGIEVAALDWGPGVRSARWGPADRSHAQRLLDALGDTADRRARMVCWLALAVPAADGEPTVETFSGVVEGTVATEPRGSGGFGYDPVFLLASGVTTAELGEGEKDLISHRGRAVAAALPRLAELVADADRTPAG
jgi:XTP/dITP diphosphohydrolase